MIRRSEFHINKLILSLLVFMGSVSVLFSQHKLNGIINEYGRVTSIGINYVIVSDPVQFSKFSPGDTTLLIQMKGVRISVIFDVTYSTPESIIGKPGQHEFLIVQSVDNITKRITFRNDIVNLFSVEGLLQLVKVPSFNSAVVDGSDVTCMPWDSTAKIGGVLTMIIGRTLSLKKNIDVSYKGFIGGAVASGTGLCVGSDPANLNLIAYDAGFLNSGFKGENPVTRGYLGPSNYPPIHPGYAKGSAANLSGGGGGNGRFSGGGGGANYGDGGRGGLEINDCSPTYIRIDGGQGGLKLKNTPLDGGIFLGGGGGSSTFGTGTPTPSAGGNGGGIVIILCDTLKGNGNSIIANGTGAVKAFGNAGAGGGGGGGSVAIYLQSFSSTLSTSGLTISANGGKGGDNNSAFGEGGGGGGGLIWTNNISLPTNVTRVVAGGATGSRPGSPTALPGSLGYTPTTFNPVLTGFLFNSVRSSVTNNQVDSVCSNMIPPKITGTKPVGGTGTYVYAWEKSYERTFSAPIVLANDTDPTNYTPKIADAITPTDTVWFRRIVTDNGPPLIIDISTPVKIVVHPAIKNNTIGNPDTICFNGNPPLIQQLLPDLIVPAINSFFISWQDSSSVNTWGSTIATTKNFDPPAGLGKTTWYRRTVRSGSCTDATRATAIVKITVLDTISSNKILTLPQDICYGTTFADLTATTPATTPSMGGGDASYRFNWESNINGAGWGPAPGVSNGPDYNPIELPQRIPSNDYLFRRVVKSGKHDVCVNTSKPVLLRDFPVITNNAIKTITYNKVLCSGMVQPRLVDSLTLSGGNSTYTYTWEYSTISQPWTSIPLAINPDYQRISPLTETTSYRRKTFSSGCSDISNSIIITVHPAISSNSISLSSGGVDTTICYGQKPYQLIGTVATGGIGAYNYQWLDSTATKNLSSVSGAGTGVNYSPGNLTATTYYKRQVVSGACIVKSNATITVTVLPVISNNIISTAASNVCPNTVPEPLIGATLSGGSGTYLFLWQDSTGTAGWVNISGGTSATYQPPILSSPAKYKRIVYSGTNNCCLSTSNTLNIGINPLPGKPYAGPDTVIYSVEKIYHMKANPVLTGEAGLWTLISGTGDPDDNSNNTIVRNLSPGKNVFLWTVSKTPCTLDDSVSIELLEDFIPQGFSPNGDAWNNTFVIEGLDLEDQYVDLSVVNGAGTEVFSTSNRNGKIWIDWDGKNDKGFDLPEGTYYYLLNITLKDDKPVSKKSGFIVLKRY